MCFPSARTASIFATPLTLVENGVFPTRIALSVFDVLDVVLDFDLGAHGVSEEKVIGDEVA